MAPDLNALQYNMTNNYLSQVQLLDALDEYGTSPLGYDGSLFNSSGLNYTPINLGLDYSVFGGGFGGGCGGYYGMSPKDIEYRKTHTDAEWQEYQAEQADILEQNNLERQIKRQQRYASAKFRIEAPDKNIAMTLGDLNTELRNNNQYKVTDRIKDLNAQVKAKYKVQGVEISDKDARAEIESQYHAVFGANLSDDLEENGRGYFAQGLLEGLGGGLGYLFSDNKNKTGADNVNFLKGESRTLGDEAKLWAGRAITGLITAPLLLLAPALLMKGGSRYIKAVGDVRHALT